MSPAQDSKQQVLQTLKQKIAGMEKVFAELTHVSNTTGDLDLQGSLREQLTELNEDIAAAKARRDAIAASAEVVAAPSAQEIQDIQDGLHALDGFVRTDENVHASVGFLQQVLAQLKG